MGLKYKINVLDELKKKGYTTYRLRQENILGQSVIQNLRDNAPISWKNLECLCGLLDIQPGDIIEYSKV